MRWWRGYSVRERFWSVLGGLAVLSTFCFVLPILALLGRLDSEWLIKLLALVVSWPAAAVLIACVVLPRFQAPITAYLARATKIDILNALSIAAPQPPSAADVEPGQNATSGTGIVPQNTDERPKSSAFVERERLIAQIQHWKLSYYGQFLVPRTQQLLYWIAQHSPTSAMAIDNQWRILIAFAEQAVMLNVLNGAGFIDGPLDAISVTDEGRKFLAAYARWATTPTVLPPAGVAPLNSGSTLLTGLLGADKPPVSTPLSDALSEILRKGTT